MGEKGRIFVQKHFNLEAFADRHERYYSLILSNAQTTTPYRTSPAENDTT